MKNPEHLFLFVLAAVLLFSCNASEMDDQSVTIPVIGRDWWQLTTTYPDISPYEYTKGDNKVCDFTIFRADDGSWQLIAIIK